MKSFGYGLLTGVLLSVIIVAYGRNHFVKKEYIPKVKIVKEVVSDTIWKERYTKLKLETSQTKDGNIILRKDVFDNILNCVGSDITASSNIKDNKLIIKAEDLCKEATISIDLKTYYQPPRHILQGGYKYTYGLGSGYEASYLYNLKYLAIGSGVDIYKNNLGIKILVQVPIK